MRSSRRPGIATLLFPLLLVVGGVRAEFPTQTRPASTDPFLGTWEGTWSEQGSSGGVSAELSRLSPDTVRFQATLSGMKGTDKYEAPAKFSRGELNVALPTLTMVFRLHGNDHLEVAYDHRGFPGRYSFTRTKAAAGEAPAQAAAMPAATQDSFMNTLVTGSPWSGEFGPRPPGTLTVRFVQSGGSVTGEVTAIDAGTSKPGPLSDVRLDGEKVSFRMPGNNVQVDLALKERKLEGTWFGRSSGWMALTPSKQ